MTRTYGTRDQTDADLDATPRKLVVWQTANVVTIATLQRLQSALSADQTKPAAASVFRDKRLYFSKQ